MGNQKKFDLVIFGASGFTGQFVVEEFAKLLRDKEVEPFTWAVAGRSKAKLSKVLEEASKVTGKFCLRNYLISRSYSVIY